jgi:hypothetical protein
VIYDVDEALAKVLDPNVNRCERAVAFFEFYVALLYCSGLAASVDGRSSFRIEVGGRHLYRARMCAWMSCLQHLCPAGPSDRAAAAAGAEPEAPTGNSINEYLQGALQFGRGGGWGNVLRDWEVDAVEDELASRWKQFSRVAPLLDFSIRIDPEDLGPRKTGGVTMALEILTENRFLGVRVSRTALAQLWSQYKPVSVFSYLFATQKYARPSPLVSEHFGEHLLHIIDSREDLGPVSP